MNILACDVFYVVIRLFISREMSIGSRMCELSCPLYLNVEINITNHIRSDLGSIGLISTWFVILVSMLFR